MLLELENTDSTHLNKLIDYARQLNLKLSLVDDDAQSTALPGKPLSAQSITALIETSRKSGTISIRQAHEAIKNQFDTD
jgi:hypothetical protein